MSDTTTETVSVTFLTDEEVDTINAARRVLAGYESRCLHDQSWDAGVLHAGAAAAAYALFQVLNCANAYAHQPLTNEQIHNDGRP